LYYFVEAMNRNGQSAGPARGVATLAGAVPPPVQGLTATLDQHAVLLSWIPAKSEEESASTVVRLYRYLLPRTTAKEGQKPLVSTEQPRQQGPPLVVGGLSEKVVDQHVHMGDSYQYRVQRVDRVVVGGHTLELDGYLSAPVLIHTASGSPSKSPDR
jgi:hypothetical protein